MSDDLALQRVIDRLKSNDRSNLNDETSAVDCEIERLTSILEVDLSRVDLLIEALGILTHNDFFRTLPLAVVRLGWSSKTVRMMGLLAARFYTSLLESRRSEFRIAMTAPNQTEFYLAQQTMPHIIERADIPADVLADWMMRISERLRGNFDFGGFANAIKAMAIFHPLIALAVASRWSLGQLDHAAVWRSADIIGLLRALSPGLEGLSELENTLSASSTIKRRLVFHRSWIATGVERGLTDGEFESRLMAMNEEGDVGESEAFHFLSCILPLPSTTQTALCIGLRWIHGHTTSESEEVWRCGVVGLARTLHDRCRLLESSLSLLLLIPRVLPTSDEQSELWRETESLLRHLWHTDRPAFRIVLVKLGQTSIAILRAFERYGLFASLISEMALQFPVKWIEEFMLSSEIGIRRLGLRLFEALGINETLFQSYADNTDSQIVLLIITSQIEDYMLCGDVAARFLISLLKRVETAGDGLKEIYVQECVFHAKNLPGECLTILKSKKSESALLARAIDAVDEYFERLSSCHRSAVNAMEAPGLRLATRIKSNRDSRRLSEFAKQKNPFFRLISTSYLLYGSRRFLTYVGGRVSETSETQQFKETMEFPRLPCIDPDGLAQRRIRAANVLETVIATAKKEVFP